jgi:hypothetical protein
MQDVLLLFYNNTTITRLNISLACPPITIYCTIADSKQAYIYQPVSQAIRQMVSHLTRDTISELHSI